MAIQRATGGDDAAAVRKGLLYTPVGVHAPLESLAAAGLRLRRPSAAALPEPKIYHLLVDTRYHRSPEVFSIDRLGDDFYIRVLILPT